MWGAAVSADGGTVAWCTAAGAVHTMTMAALVADSRHRPEPSSRGEARTAEQIYKFTNK